MSGPAGTDQFVLLVTVPIKPGREDEYLALVNAVNDEMRHEATFVNTLLHRSADDPGLFMLYETWRDHDDFFSTQMKRPYRADYETKMPGLLRAPRTMAVFETLRADHSDGTVSKRDPIEVIERFYSAEADYMNAGGAAARADFTAMAATLAPDVVLHQSPDLPWGGDFHGRAGYEDWARQMSAAFDRLEVRDRRFSVAGDTVIITCRLITRARASGAALDLPMAQVVRVRGEHIVEFRPFYWNVPAYRETVGSVR